MMFRLLSLLLLFTSWTVAIAAEPETPASKGPLKWYKGNLHTHSLWSDGNDFPEMICAWYKTRGYQFLALSDHNILSVGEKWVDSQRATTKDAIGGLERFREHFKDRVQTKEENGKTLVRLSPLSEFRLLFEEPEKFLLIQAEEITDSFKSLPIHVNGHNLQETIKPQRGETLRDTIANNLKAIDEQGKRLKQPTLGHLNHPNFGYAVTAEDMAHVKEEKFFEVYNGHPIINHLGDNFKTKADEEAEEKAKADKAAAEADHGHSHAHGPLHHASVEKMWDIANTIRVAELKQPPLMGIGTDDSHNYFGLRGASPGRGWVVVRAPELTAAALIKALHAGEFYASSGIVLKDFAYDAKKRQMRIEIDPQPNVSYTTALIGTLESASLKSEPVVDPKTGKELTVTRKYSADVGRALQVKSGASVTFQLTGKELYARAVVTSSKTPDNPSFRDQKEQAWLQPVGWQERLAAPAAGKGSPTR